MSFLSRWVGALSNRVGRRAPPPAAPGLAASPASFEVQRAFDPAWLVGLVTGAHRILDAGCGPHGSFWWSLKPDQTAMVAVDLYNQPPSLPANTRFFRSDIVEFCRRDEYQGAFDLVVADHLLEHVPDMAATISGFHRALQSGGRLHVGIPDATMFTDRFYHLVHPDSGGHVSKPTLESLTRLMDKGGFDRVEFRPWPDDWQWFKRLYDWRGRGIKYFSQDDVDYIADVFLKELTPEKGYYYGWEIIFARRPSGAGEQPAAPQASAPAAPPAIGRLFPASTAAGRAFNPQPDGQSAISVECERATLDTVIVLDGTPLPTTYGGPNLVTALVPAALLAEAGPKPLYLKNHSGESNRVDFVVTRAAA